MNNYERTDNNNDKIKLQELYEKIGLHLTSLNKQQLTSYQICSLVISTFGKLPYHQATFEKKKIGYYSNLRRKGDGHNVIRLRIDKIVKQWLIANYERTANKDDKVRLQHLRDKLNTHLTSLGGEQLNKNQIGRLVTSTFGSINYSKVNAGQNLIYFYNNLKEKGLESNGSQVSLNSLSNYTNS